MKTMHTNRWSSIAFVSLWLAAGCAGPGGPNKVEDISGVKNLSRDGRIYIGGTPDHEGLTALKARGVRTVIDLRQSEELRGDEAEAVRQRGMVYHHLPMQSDQLTDQQAETFIRIMRECDKEPVLVHCAGGSRAGAMYGLYLGADGKCPLDEAIQRARAAGLRNEKLEKDLETSLRNRKQTE